MMPLLLITWAGHHTNLLLHLSSFVVFNQTIQFNPIESTLNDTLLKSDAIFTLEKLNLCLFTRR